jgi:hypothetical protein
VEEFLKELGLLLIEVGSGGKPILYLNKEMIIINKNNQGLVTIQLSSELQQVLCSNKKKHLKLVD